MGDCGFLLRRTSFAEWCGRCLQVGSTGPAWAGPRPVARGGPVTTDPGVFVETSSYGARATGAVAEALGVEQMVAGSDEPYARYTDPLPGAGLETVAVARLLG